MKATDQYFPVVLFIKLCKVALFSESVGELKMKGTLKYFPVVLFIKQCKVVLTFAYLDEVLQCDHSIESY